jgi:hypothetical protein
MCACVLHIIVHQYHRTRHRKRKKKIKIEIYKIDSHSIVYETRNSWVQICCPCTRTVTQRATPWVYGVCDRERKRQSES